MTKYLMLRVGIDGGAGGTLSPVNEKREFEFIPIPEVSPNNVEARGKGFKTYKEFKNRYTSFKPLADYVPLTYRNWFVHSDPEFETFTYGDPTNVKSKALRKLRLHDWLIFYAGLKDVDTGVAGLYLVGYFYIEGIFFEDILLSNLSMLSNNAHIRRNPKEGDLVIAKGEEKRSKLLRLAEPITEAKRSFRPYYPLLSSFTKLTGLDKDIMRSSPFWLLPSSPPNFEKWLLSLK